MPFPKPSKIALYADTLKEDLLRSLENLTTTLGFRNVSPAMERLQVECRRTAKDYLQKWGALAEPSQLHWEERLEKVREKIDEYDQKQLEES